MEKIQDERLKTINKVSTMTLAINIVLSVIKFLAGIFANSSAMIADSVHTVSDVVTTVAVMIGSSFAAKPDDEDHQYGHERIESVVAKMLALVLFFTALGIGYSGIINIINDNYQRPGIFAVIAAIISIISKEWMYRYTVKAADNVNSAALKADAWHHRSDAMSSIGTLIGVGGAMLGVEILDPIAAVAVSFMIIKVSADIFIQSFNQLTDKSAGKEVGKAIKNCIWEIEGIKSVDQIKTRMHGARIYADVEIAVDGECTVKEGHEIAENVHNAIENTLPNVKHCMVHVNPHKQ